MDYIRYAFTSDRTTSEILIAFLSEWPFDTFQETETGLDAFIPVELHNPNVEKGVTELKNNFRFSFEKELIKERNWNEIWESNFQPVSVEGFCGIRADFHPPFENMEHEIIINPKMAFGTGHHETTFMMMEFMKDIGFTSKSVFDYGCGTGILAILAAKMGCTDLDAVDIEKPAYLNSIENAELNKTNGIGFYEGTLENVPERNYDIILANINRNVILESLPTLYQRLKPAGILMTSGFLEKDKTLVLDAHRENGFFAGELKHKGKWMALKAFRRY